MFKWKHLISLCSSDKNNHADDNGLTADVLQCVCVSDKLQVNWINWMHLLCVTLTSAPLHADWSGIWMRPKHQDMCSGLRVRFQLLWAAKFSPPPAPDLVVISGNSITTSRCESWTWKHSNVRVYSLAVSHSLVRRTFSKLKASPVSKK